MATPRGYSSKNVGNDASARPWERQGPSLDAGTAAGSQGGFLVGQAPVEGLFGFQAPSGFDIEGFLAASKANFVALQNAWDCADTASLRAMMTDGMLAQIQGQLAEREHSNTATKATVTEVEMLEARLLGVEELQGDYMASVEFSGLLREAASVGPSPFRELWSVTRSKTDGDWRVADVQALQ
ncbi:MAG: Tim44-like domain-containing protein [Hydrogenophaga sp.]